MPRAAIVSASESGVASLSIDTPERFRYGRERRLLDPARFSEVFAARQVLRSAHFALHYLANELAEPRLGLVIPKKQARTAVLRNALKRQIRELFRQRRPGLPSVDIVLRLAQACSGRSHDLADRAAWRTEISSLLDQLSRKAMS